MNAEQKFQAISFLILMNISSDVTSVDLNFELFQRNKRFFTFSVLPQYGRRTKVLPRMKGLSYHKRYILSRIKINEGSNF